ncbi:MAG TPA: SseB family protein [Actinomycetes bacterium]|nr:SseB family protein [Actinomycetes bacterium]
MTGADSAGVPWGGRTLPTPGFTGDHGLADPTLEAALQELAQAGSDESAVLAAHVRVHAALAQARLLVPVVAVLDTVSTGVDGLHADKSTDMALVTLQARDGARAVPAFTALDRLSAWRPDARPVPAEARRVALSVVAEGATRVVLDPAGPVTYVLERAPLWALAQGRAWLGPAEDPAVREAVADALAPADVVRAAWVRTTAPSGLRLTLALPPGLARDTLTRLVTEVSHRLGDDQRVADRVDGVSIVLRGDGPAAATEPGRPLTLVGRGREALG